MNIYFCFLEGHLRWPDNGDKEALWAPVPICTPEGGALMGWVGHPAHMAPKGCHYRSRFIFFLLVARPLAFGSFPAPMGTHWVPICAPLRGAHYKSRSFYTRVCDNFGQNYRDLGVNLRAPFSFIFRAPAGPQSLRDVGASPHFSKTHYRGPDIPCFLI